MAPLAEVGVATANFEGQQGGPATCSVLFHPSETASRQESEAALVAWWQAYKDAIAPFLITGTAFALSRDIQWRDPVTAEILADSTLPSAPGFANGGDELGNVSRACGIRMYSSSNERVDNRRVRTGFVVPYIGQSAINEQGQVASLAFLSFFTDVLTISGAEDLRWAAWHRPVYERDAEGERILIEPGVAYTAGTSLAARPYVSVLRSRRD